MIIYKITNKINLKSYVGQTINNLEHRWYYHVKSKNCKALHAAIEKYGKENFLLEILLECTSRKELDLKETELIKKHNTMSPNGYNLRPGGNTSTHSAETRRKISEKRKGRSVPHTKESKRKISEANKKRVWTQESKNKVSVSMTGKSNGPHKDSVKNKMSIAHNKSKVAILCIENGIIYESVKFAARTLNLNKSHIFSVLAGTRKRVKGYTFQRV
jgi:group I intron endonuclease